MPDTAFDSSGNLICRQGDLVQSIPKASREHDVIDDSHQLPSAMESAFARIYGAAGANKGDIDLVKNAMLKLQKDLAESQRKVFATADIRRENKRLQGQILQQQKDMEAIKAVTAYLRFWKFDDVQNEINKHPKSESKLNHTIMTLTGMVSAKALRKFYELVQAHLSVVGEDPDNLNFYRGPYTEDKKDTTKGAKSELSGLEQLFFFLFVTRTGTPIEIASAQFGISQPTGTRYFCTWTDCLARVLMLEMPFPSSEISKESYPERWRELFGDSQIRLVLDCTNIDVETHSDPFAQRVTYSSYYSGNVAKILIGVSPAGALVFASLCYPGRCSDTDLTEHSLLQLELLKPGDQVMGDRGFTIHHLLFRKLMGMWMAAKRKPNQKSFTFEQSKFASNIHRERIHVERAVKRFKAFKYLKRTIPVNQFDILSHLAFVVVMLCNYQVPLTSRISKQKKNNPQTTSSTGQDPANSSLGGNAGNDHEDEEGDDAGMGTDDYDTEHEVTDEEDDEDEEGEVDARHSGSDFYDLEEEDDEEEVGDASLLLALRNQAKRRKTGCKCEVGSCTCQRSR
jgi:hypothetical protein